MLPLEERMGWDTIDMIKASAWGWDARVVDDIPFRHHRLKGYATAVRTWAIQGRANHYMGYRFSYLLVRTLYRAQDPTAIALLGGTSQPDYGASRHARTLK